MLAALAPGRARAAAIDVALVTVPVAVATECDADAVLSAVELRRAFVKEARDAGGHGGVPPGRVGAARELHEVRPVRPHDLDHGRASDLAGGGHERDLLAAGIPGRMAMSLTGRAYTRQLRDGRPVGVHHVDLGVAVAVARERDLRAVGRPGGVPVVGTVVREVDETGAVGIHHVDLAVTVALARERDLGPVGRPGRMEISARSVREPHRV